MNKRHQKTLASIFAVPTAASLKFGDIENLMLALGAKVIEGNGSRVAFEMKKQRLFFASAPSRKRSEKISGRSIQGVFDFGRRQK